MAVDFLVEVQVDEPRIAEMPHREFHPTQREAELAYYKLRDETLQAYMERDDPCFRARIALKSPAGKSILESHVFMVNIDFR